MLIRAMQPDDWPAVVRIYAEGIATGDATFETIVPSPEVLDAKWLPDHRWVALIGGRIAGWATFTSVSDRVCYRGVVENSVYIDADKRGRGVGKALLHKQIDHADEAEIWTIQSMIFPENVSSIALHQRCGFRIVGTRERIGKLDGVWRDTVLLERRK